MKVLVLNGGSSSLKAVLHDVGGGPLPPTAPAPLWDARADWGRHPGKASLRIRTRAGALLDTEIGASSPESVLDPVLSTLWEGDTKVLGGRGEIDVVGHRVVHGGKAFRETSRITAEVKTQIARFVEFAPEHNRLELEAIEAAERVLGPDVPQIAVFDTAFHTTLPPAATVYPGPYGWLAEGIRRYGFHGISHQYVSERASQILGRDLGSLRLITCHLGNGASLAAVRDGRSIDTTMGFTPLEGMMMGSRSGSIDPGIIIYLVRNCGYKADQLDHILNKESGLKGISGVSADMREVLAARERGDDRARLAFDVYMHRLCQEIGAMLGSLGGVDALVFTAGVGENCAPLRARVCRQFAFLGLRIDSARNEGSPVDEDISQHGSNVRVLVVHTDEDWQIVRECYRLAAPATGVAP
jgi:acetate kinase